MLYTALDQKGNPIITVIADSPEGARAKVREQLDRDYRRQWYLREWEEAGEPAIPRRRLERAIRKLPPHLSRQAGGVTQGE